MISAKVIKAIADQLLLGFYRYFNSLSLVSWQVLVFLWGNNVSRQLLLK